MEKDATSTDRVGKVQCSCCAGPRLPIELYIYVSISPYFYFLFCLRCSRANISLGHRLGNRRFLRTPTVGRKP